MSDTSAAHHGHPEHYEDDCPECQAESFLNGNRGAVRRNIRKHPDPAVFVLDVLYALTIDNADCAHYLDDLTNLLDR